MTPAPLDPSAPAPPRDAPRNALGRRLARLLGSLQVALVLLPLFAGVLVLGTFVESIYDTRVAHQLVYDTWWFVGLLGLLGVNIVCAALKKRPWKKHQTGFLITHVGLLTLVAGGLVTRLGGIQGMMTLIDTEDARYFGHGVPASSTIVDPVRDRIRVRRGRAITQRSFDPGPAAWNAAITDTPALAFALDRLAHPWPRSWSMELESGARLHVIDYHPHVITQPFKPAAPNDPAAFPALAVGLTSPATGPLPPAWLAFHGEQRRFRRGPGLVELLARRLRPEQKREFDKPPARPGKNGTLVLGLAGQTFRWDVARLLDQPATPLGETGWSLRLAQYMPSYRDAASTVASDPGLALELTRADVKVKLAVTARQAGELFPMGKDPVPWQTLPGLWVWYHPPDYRYADGSLKAVLQLAPGAEDVIHYRTFSSAKTGFGFEKAGTIRQGAAGERIWAGMGWKFQVTAFVPRAAAGQHLTPVARPLGQVDQETVPAIRCFLTVNKFTTDFWLPRTADEWTSVALNDEEFFVGFNASQLDLDFTLRLVRAEQTTDVGTSLPASQTSFVLLTDPGRKIDGVAHAITLNQPLSYRGFRFYQVGYQALGTESEGRPISQSTLKVEYDPGLWFKYAGSCMVALGIACMFYMKAYFFRYLGSGG